MTQTTTSTSKRRQNIENTVLTLYDAKRAEGQSHGEACDAVAKEKNMLYYQVTYIVRKYRMKAQEAAV